LLPFAEELSLDKSLKYSQAQISGLLKTYVKKKNIYISKEELTETEKLNHPTKKIFMADDVLTKIFQLTDDQKRMDIG
jgi:hypothetical protein